MITQYKLPDVNICNQGICIPSPFLLVRNLQQQVILGTLFLNLLMSLQKIDQIGIYCTNNGQEVVFEFIREPKTRLINEIKTMIGLKEKQLNFLREDVHIMDISQMLQNPSLKIKIQELEKKFSKRSL